MVARQTQPDTTQEARREGQVLQGRQCAGIKKDDPQSERSGVLGVSTCRETRKMGGAGLPWGAVVARLCSPVVPWPPKAFG